MVGTKDKGQTIIEFVLLLTVILGAVLLGTRLIRNSVYPALDSVQTTVKEVTLCGKTTCGPQGVVNDNGIQRKGS